jgi:exopolysaccharide production protein ExoQ
MPATLATALFVLAIAGLFVLDHQRKANTSPALWIPVMWLSIVASREVSVWLETFGIGDSARPTNLDPYLEGNPIDRVVFTGLLILGLVVLVRRGPRVGRLLQENWPIVLFFLYCGLSAMWSDYPGIAFKRWIKALGDVVMVMIVLSEVDPLAAIQRWLARVGFLLIPLSILLIKYYSSIGKQFKHYGTPIYVGVTTNKNLLGVVCLIFGLASLWRILLAFKKRNDRNSIRRIVAHSAVLAMVLWLFSMAHSSTSLVCFLVAGTLMVFTSLSRGARQPAIVHCAVAVIIAVSFSILILGVGDGALEAIGKDTTLTGRTDIWRLVLGMTDNPLLGSGFESFWLGSRLDKIWNLIWWHPNEAHNGYIEVFLNLGWVGLAMLAVLLVTGYRNVLISLRRDPEVGILKLAFFVVALMYSFTEAGFRMLSAVWISLLLSIVAVPSVPTRFTRPLATLNVDGSADEIYSCNP